MMFHLRYRFHNLVANGLGCRSYLPLLLFGICDINDLGLLMKPKTRSIRIVGGPEIFNDQFYMMFADALCVAEGFEFFKDYKRLGSLDKVFERP